MTAVSVRSNLWNNRPILLIIACVRNMVGKVVDVISRNEVPVHSDSVDLEVDGCIFCSPRDSSLNNIWSENKTFFARFDNFPANPGHLEIVPKRHVESFFALSSREAAEMYALLCKAKEHLLAEYRPDGYTIGVNEGVAAGQSIRHLHIHLIPRHHGDVKDPRGGIRQVVPNCDPDSWTPATESS